MQAAKASNEIREALDLGPRPFLSVVKRRLNRPWEFLIDEEMIRVSSQAAPCGARAVLARTIEDAVTPGRSISRVNREDAWAWLLRPIYAPRNSGEGLTVEQAVEAAALPLWQLLEGLILVGEEQIAALYGGRATSRLLAEVRARAARDD